MKIKGLVISALLLFYILCWLTDQPTKLLWWLGVALPWLSIFLAIPITILDHIEEKDNWKIWCYIYAVATLFYIVVVQAIGGLFLQILPHLLCCAFGVAYLVLNKKVGGKR